MIVQQRGATQLLITQPDHAALAGRIMQHWRSEGLTEAARRHAILLAIEEHDNGWREVDAAPILDSATGRIVDFIAAPDDVKRSVWPRGVERLVDAPYAAALVAQHAVHIYRRYRDDPGWTAFFAGLERLRDQALGMASATLGDLTREYFFVRVGDLMSLAFCNGWTDPRTDDSGSGYAIRLDGLRLTISPDPFENREVPLEVMARELPNRAFDSPAEAREVYLGARRIGLSGVAVGSTT